MNPIVRKGFLADLEQNVPSLRRNHAEVVVDTVRSHFSSVPTLKEMREIAAEVVKEANERSSEEELKRMVYKACRKY